MFYFYKYFNGLLFNSSEILFANLKCSSIEISPENKSINHTVKTVILMH